jgi:ADP-ribose pyrophosphatase
MITVKPWTTIDRRVEFSGGPIREIVKETVLLPDGRVIPDFYTARMGDYALVYAVTESETVLLLRQYKHGVGRVCLTFPGGYVAPGENPAVAAERELLEETGYRGSRVTTLGSFVTNANQGCNTAHLFRIDGCRRERDPDSGDLEEMELVHLAPEHLLTAARFDEMGVLGYVTLALLANAIPHAQQ